MPAQTLAAGFGGVNPFGRWMYGPWFYPATVVEKGPVANPYYDQDCSSPFPNVYANCTTPGQPTMIPGTPNVSMGMEAFQDSAVVNGTAFPSLTVDPRAYRFRILNAASDRFFNLSFYVADPAQVSPDQRLTQNGRSNLTEVKTVPASASLAAANNWPADWPVDGRDGGVPDPATMGPSWLQIGTEGGFLPKPVTINPQPITYITDPTAFWVGNVDKMGLALGPAERADVVVDFAPYAGQTLILYNDAPAAWPARVPGYDYYTGAPDQRDTGGYGTGGTYNAITGVWESGTGPLVGFAPNTRTVMQIIVRGSAPQDAYVFNEAALVKEFTKDAPVTDLNPAPTKTLFERAQEPIIVGQQAYKDAYPNSYFPPNYPWEGINQINDHFLKFVTIDGQPVIAPTEPKGIHDEMGASFDPVYGRMSGNLGMQLPNPTTLTANLILYGFVDLPTETIQNSTQLKVTVMPDPVTGFNTLADGTQIWKISHNGVDTHPIHFHIFDVQLINRVGWDGQILMPEPNELGWKDTVKISPLEDTIVAVRPRAPALPFGIPNSLRPLNPGIPLDSPMGFNSIDWVTGNAITPPVTNALYDFGWEYVWHCHILSHEEMDMMRPIVLKVVNNLPAAPVLTAAVANGAVNLVWSDATPVDYVTQSGFGNPAAEIGFRIERCAGFGCTNFAPYQSMLANQTSFNDAIGANEAYRYRVTAYNAAGNRNSNIVTASTVPLSITTTNLPNGTVNVSYNATVVASGGNPDYTWSATGLPSGLSINPSTGVISGTPGSVVPVGSATSATFNVQVSAKDVAAAVVSQAFTLKINQKAPAAPSNLTGNAVSANRIVLNWTDNSNNEAGFQIQRATNSGFTSGVTSVIQYTVNMTSYTDNTVAPGVTYYYRVRSLNALAYSTTWSNTVVVATSTFSITTTALANASINATYNQTLQAVGGVTPYVWSASGLPTGLTLNGSTGVISGTPALSTIPRGATSATFSVTINVHDSASTQATGSTTLNLKVNQSAPAAPSGLAASTPAAGRVVLNWTDNANNEAGFQIQRSTDPTFATGSTSVIVYTVNLTTYTDNTVTSGVTYYYRVRSLNALTYSTTYSNTASIQAL